MTTHELPGASLVGRKIKPISKMRKTTLDRLAPLYRRATIAASDCLDIETKHSVRLETYRTDDLKHLIGNVWQWNTKISGLEHDDDIQRVQKIIDLLQTGEERWPYVSYWATDMEDLSQTEDEDNGEVSVPNHGDGWHRLVAAFELQLPTTEILYVL